MRKLLASVALAAVLTAPASAQLVIAPPTPPPLPVPVDDAAILAFGEVATRMTVPVSIGTRGPWRFIVDTGAERTVVSRELAGVLGLAAGPVVRVTAMTGTSSVATVLVPTLSVSAVSKMNDLTAPALESANMGAVGMLGLDALQGHSVAIDFDRRQMTLRPSQRKSAARVSFGDEIIVTARSYLGQLIVTDAHWRRQKIAVIIDTGSPVTIGNSALLAAILKRPKLTGPIEVVSATGGILRANSYLIDRLELGGVGFGNVPVAISDVPPFRRFGLSEKPALLLGMDALRLFRAVQIDFPNRQIRFTLPRRPYELATRN